MGAKIIPATNKEGYVPEVKYKAKPKAYVMSESLKQYIIERDRCLYKTCDAETRKEILERYGKT